MPRGYSGSSSRKRTPKWAREISPGEASGPPPMSEIGEAVWWGLRKGRSWTMSCVMPPREWILVMAIFSSLDGLGRRLRAARASMVLPAPGGPEIRILWRPAMAMTMARLACCWPRIWSSIVGMESVLVFFTTMLGVVIMASPLRWRKSDLRSVTPTRLTPETREACGRLACGR